MRRDCPHRQGSQGFGTGADTVCSFSPQYGPEEPASIPGCCIVMSAQKHSLQTRDLARFKIDLIYIYIYIYIYNRVWITFLIFSLLGFL